jgi:hypothetical protein
MGDRVAAENYLQHAEHYYRLLAAASAPRAQGGGNGQARPGETVAAPQPQPEVVPAERSQPRAEPADEVADSDGADPEQAA